MIGGTIGDIGSLPLEWDYSGGPLGRACILTLSVSDNCSRNGNDRSQKVLLLRVALILNAALMGQRNGNMCEQMAQSNPNPPPDAGNMSGFSSVAPS
jgi:hypothetical protein